MARYNKDRKSNPIIPNGSNMSYRVFNNRIVEAKLNGTSVSFAFQHYMEDIFKDSDMIRPIYNNATNLADTYYGRAYCNVDEGDNFDIETGKDIASGRCTALFRQDFDEMIVKLLEELHRIEAKIFNRLRKRGKLNVYFKAQGVDEFYDSSIRMPGQPCFFEVSGINTIKSTDK